MKKALLVIDIQNDFLWENRDKKKFHYKNIDKLISNINNNIEKLVNNKINLEEFMLLVEQKEHNYIVN